MHTQESQHLTPGLTPQGSGTSDYIVSLPNLDGLGVNPSLLDGLIDWIE